MKHVGHRAQGVCLVTGVAVDIMGAMWEDFNYCWWGPGLIDWARLDWREDVRELMLFNDNALFNAYRRRWELVQNTTDMHKAVDELSPHLLRHKDNIHKVQRICK